MRLAASTIFPTVCEQKNWRSLQWYQFNASLLTVTVKVYYQTTGKTRYKTFNICNKFILPMAHVFSWILAQTLVKFDNTVELRAVLYYHYAISNGNAFQCPHWWFFKKRAQKTHFEHCLLLSYFYESICLMLITESLKHYRPYCKCWGKIAIAIAHCSLSWLSQNDQ